MDRRRNPPHATCEYFAILGEGGELRRKQSRATGIFRRDPNEGRKPTALDQVRGLLADDAELSTAQLVEITGYAERTVRKAVRELSEEEPEE